MSISVSIVTHGHAEQLLGLLRLLSESGVVGGIRRVWVTVNIPEAMIFDAFELDGGGAVSLAGNLRIHFIFNETPLGFGANHNQAFECEQMQATPSDYFVVMNPDILWGKDPWGFMLAAAKKNLRVGCVYPTQIDSYGVLQDFRRAIPSPLALWRRYVHGGSWRVAEVGAVDWVNAALLLFPSGVYAEIGGFDDEYHMYCEDVDICLRLRLAGYQLVEASDACVTHVARRASRKNLRHFVWHIRSLFRLWRSIPYREFMRQRNALR